MDWNSIFDYDVFAGRLLWKIGQGSLKRIGAIAGCVKKNNYTEIRYKNKKYYAHRIIWEMHNGPIPEGKIIDHANGIKGQDYIYNLRLATKIQNGQNSKLRVDNKSGFKGVRWHRAAKKWQARIVVNGKSTCLGYFDCKYLAHKAYCESAKQNFGEFVRAS